MGQLKNIKNVNIDRLIPYENNAKVHSPEQIKKLADSIAEFGFISPVLIDKDYNIIAGHGRVMAAKSNGMTDIPCCFVEGLTAEQRAAYILADNRLSEFGKWDMKLVSLEMEKLAEKSFNIDVVSFDLPELSLPDSNSYYGDERERTMKTYNLDISQKGTEDFWQMPIIENDGYIPEKLIGFNYAKSSKEKAAGIHFFIDDYQFERVWNYPEKYVEVLKEYECILSPDFSLYMEMPMPMKIWNIYRSRQIGAYYQSKGIKVIPTISWAEISTFQFCFLGIPKHSIVAISTIGVKKEDEAFKIWQEGVKTMIEQIEPSDILIYGGKLEFDYGDIKTHYYENEVTKKWK